MEKGKGQGRKEGREKREREGEEAVKSANALKKTP